jgi:hypothetical protein
MTSKPFVISNKVRDLELKWVTTFRLPYGSAEASYAIPRAERSEYFNQVR